MNSARPFFAARRSPLLAILAAATVALGSSGCVYRLAVQQGNIVDEDKVAQVTVGMTRNQVRFLLGTPMIDDPFNRGRWDYLYYVQRGGDRPIENRWITLYFENNSVARIVRDDPPADAEAATAAAAN